MGRYSGFCFSIASLAFLMGCVAVLQPAGEPAPIAARSLAVGGPVAVISWLPPEVSNGTWFNLDGSHSYDPDGSIVNYTWDIDVNNITSSFWGQAESYKFKTLGLYKITLTVTDNNGSSDSSFTAVYSIIDVDMDGLPDWWEMRYFLNMEEIGSDDYDNDGYTDLEEYASGQDPTVQDARPGFVNDLKDNWMYVAAAAAAMIVAALFLLRHLKRKRKDEERKKIDFAIEMEKALRGEE